MFLLVYFVSTKFFIQFKFLLCFCAIPLTPLNNLRNLLRKYSLKLKRFTFLIFFQYSKTSAATPCAALFWIISIGCMKLSTESVNAFLASKANFRAVVCLWYDYVSRWENICSLRASISFLLHNHQLTNAFLQEDDLCDIFL